MKKLNVVEYAKLQAYIFGLLGLLAGLLYSLGGFFIDLFVTLNLITTTETPGLSYGTVLAFGALIGMPLIGAICGLILGLVGAYVYNKFPWKIKFT